MGPVHGAVDERVGQAAEFFGRQRADVRRVDGPQLERVKDGRGLGDARGGSQMLTIRPA